jgi:hypothetical protein
MISAAFRNATLSASADCIVNVFADGRVNHMWFYAINNAEYHAIAEWAGYGDDWKRYAVEHDFCHHWLADELGDKWCDCLRNPSGLPIGEAPQAHQDREHQINRLQRQAHTGEPDEYGVLQRMGLDKRVPELKRELDGLWNTP